MLTLAETPVSSSLIEHGLWPLMAFVTTMVGFLIFRHPLAGFIARCNRVGIGPVAADAQQSAANTSDPSQGGHFSHPPGPNRRLQPDTETVRRAEANVRNDLPRLYGPAVADQIDGLINALAYTQVWARFEMTYRLIYGSQVGFLQYLNVQGVPVARTAAEQFFGTWKTARPFLQNLPFDQWVGFLMQQSLVLYGADGYAITQDGQEFLSWMVRSRVSPDRPG